MGFTRLSAPWGIALLSLTLAACGRDDSPSRLTGYEWTLTSAIDGGGEPIALLQPDAGGRYGVSLSFDDKQILIHSGCNTLSGAYALRKDQLRLGEMRVTDAGCIDRRRMDMDLAVQSRLNGNLMRMTDGTSAAPRLILVNAAGDRFQFGGKRAAQPRSSEPGEFVYLEIAAEPIACPTPDAPARQCLYARERGAPDLANDAVPPGDWQVLYRDITGYEHTPGMREVVYVKRFIVKNPPPGMSSVAHVLERVVESTPQPPRS